MPTTRITTSRELAKLAGVSHISVSRAFRGDNGVSEATRKHILELAEKHGYRPNPIHSLHALAKNQPLSQEKLGSLAFVHFYPELSSWADQPNLAPYLSGMHAQASKLGFTLNEFALGKGAYTQKRLANVLESRGIKGVIFGPTPSTTKEVKFAWEQFASVRFSPQEWTPQLHYVADDAVYGLSICLEKLSRQGYQRIGYAIPETLNQTQYFGQEGRMLTYQKRLPPSDRIPVMLYNKPFAQDCSEEIIAWVEKYAPDCIICRSNEMKDILERNGFRVPQDIGLVHQGIGPDVEDWTGYRPDQYGIGSAAVDLVVNRLVRNEQGLPKRFREVLLRGTWQEGTTA